MSTREDWGGLCLFILVINSEIHVCIYSTAMCLLQQVIGLTAQQYKLRIH